MFDENISIKNLLIFIFASIVSLIILFFGIGYLYNNYSVWSAGMNGKAELNQAEWSRQIAVREATAKRDSAIMLAQAEVERAKGVAQANQIIGSSLKNNEDYLRYLWINNLQNDKNQVIYVPTEANLPILEASRLSK
jgi:regulator of protease activity HflC (stomatin/prohibitin superfamily)